MVKAGLMGEKPVSTNTSDVTVSELCQADECAGGGGEGEEEEVKKQVKIMDGSAMEDQTGEEVEEEGAAEGEEEEEGTLTVEGESVSMYEDITESSTKPVPPPRTDSHGPSNTRHMVDILSREPDDEELFNWDVQRDYLLACMGFVNGLGCLLKFATMTVKHGGGVFFVAYVICMCVFGCPLVYLETTLGQYANGGPLTAWKVIPLFRGVGFTMVCLTFLISLYYIMDVTWAIYYFGVAMTTAVEGDAIPWDCFNRTDGHCDSMSDWLSRKFYLSHYLPHHQFSDNLTSIDLHGNSNTTLDLIGAFQYFYKEVIELTETGEELGPPVWYLCLCLLLAWVFVYACLIYGPSSIGKVMHVTAPLPYITLPVLLGFSCVEDGALDGVKFFLNPEWHKLVGLEIWLDGAHLMVFTLGLGTGCLHTLAGYTHFHSHCFRNLTLLCLCNVLATMLAGFTMCSGLGIISNITNVSIQSFTVTEPELAFALYPFILTKLSYPLALSMVFFLTIIVIGLDSLMVLIQNLVGAFTDLMRECGHNCSRWRRWMMQLALCVMLAFIGLIFTTKGGLYASHLMQASTCHVCQFAVILLECCLLMYVFGAQKFIHHIEDMTGNKDSPWWKYNWKFISPGLLTGLIIMAFLYPIQLKYRNFIYPDWCEVLGWCLAMMPLMCIPLGAAYKLFHAVGNINQRIHGLLATPTCWGAGISHSHEQHESAPDYVICQPDNHRPMHGLAMLTANLYIPHLEAALNADELPPETGSEMTGGYLSDLVTITSSDSIDSGPENEERGNWRGKLEFVLSCLGYVVGLGNIWRFPYLVYRNGGGAFFIPYLLMMVFCGLPLVFMEMSFGQYASLGPVTIWRAVPLFKGIGYAMVAINLVIPVYYNVLNAWAFHYLFASFTSTLPWASCNNDWNSPDCSMNKFLVTNCSLIEPSYLSHSLVVNNTCSNILDSCLHNQTMMTTDVQKHNITECVSWLQKLFGDAVFVPERQKLVSAMTTPSEEYFYNKVLNQSEGIQDLGPVQWQLALYLLLCWFIVFLCLVRGIYSAGKVAYVVVIVPILLLLVLLVCSLMEEGHLEGIRFYVTPKWDKVFSMRLWSDAATQVFFSLSAANGGLLTLSSYNKFHANIYRDAIIICIVDTLMSVLAGFAVFAALGILAHELQTNVDNVVSSSMGLAFVAIPAAVLNFDPSSMWSAFFFLMILLMGMSTILVMTEVIVTVIIDENPDRLRKYRIVILVGVCLVLYLAGLPLTTRGGSYLLQLLDEYCAGIPSIVAGTFMCLALAWVYKVRNFCTDIRLMTGRPISVWWKIMWCGVTPLIMLFMLVSSIISRVELDPDQFPAWSEGLGISLAVLSVAAIPLYIVFKLVHLEGSIIKRVKDACISEQNWGPALVKHWKPVEYYPAVNTHTLSLDIEQSPVHAISDHIDFSTSDVRLPNLSQSNLLPANQTPLPRRPQELRHKAILNHAYSNPQCTISNGSIDQIKPRLSGGEASSSDIIFISKKNTGVKSRDIATQTDARSYTLALRNGSVKTLYKEMKIVEGTDVRSKHSGKNLLEVEVTQF